MGETAQNTVATASILRYLPKRLFQDKIGEHLLQYLLIYNVSWYQGSFAWIITFTDFYRHQL